MVKKMEGWLFLAYCPKTECRFLAGPGNPIVDTAVLWITLQVTHITSWLFPKIDRMTTMIAKIASFTPMARMLFFEIIFRFNKRITVG